MRRKLFDLDGLIKRFEVHAANRRNSDLLSNASDGVDSLHFLFGLGYLFAGCSLSFEHRVSYISNT